MSTSSKVQFHLDTLKTKALESIDERIALAEQEVASYDDEEALGQRIQSWRSEQERRVSDLFSRLGGGGDDIGDHELAKWKIQPIPEVDHYDRQRAEGDLRRLRTHRSKIVAKTDSLVGDEQGNISLTKTQLAEFFGL